MDTDERPMLHPAVDMETIHSSIYSTVSLFSVQKLVPFPGPSPCRPHTPPTSLGLSPRIDTYLASDECGEKLSGTSASLAAFMLFSQDKRNLADSHAFRSRRPGHEVGREWVTFQLVEGRRKTGRGALLCIELEGERYNDV